MLTLLAAACLCQPLQEPETRPVAEFLPPTTAVVLQVPQPTRLLNSALDHPIHTRAKQDKAISQLYASPQLFQVKAGLKMAEFGIGMKWREALDAVAGNGITIALDAETNGVVGVLESSDPERLDVLVRRVVKFVNNERRKKNQDPIEESTFEGVNVYKFDGAAVAVLRDRVLVTNNRDLGKQILRSIRNKPDSSLATTPAFRNANIAEQDASIRAFVNMTELRERGAMERVLEGTKSQPFAEFVLGGVLESLQQAEFLTASATLSDDALQIAASMPHKPGNVSEPREFYFGPKGQGRAPRALSMKSTIGSISAYRDLAKMWLYAGDLFDQQVNDGFAEAEASLSTLFAGKDFVEEILAEIQPEWQIVVSRQDLSNVLPRPAIKLPAFALVGELKDAETMNPELRRTFQSMVGFFNVVGAMEGNPQLDQDIDMVDGVKYLTSSFVPTPEDRESTEATIHYNFAPSLALGKDRFVLSSSLDLAKKIMSRKAGPADARRSADNTSLSITAAALRQVLDDNREQLIANNMLEDGNDREAAEQQIGLLLNIMTWFDRFEASLEPTDQQLRLNLQLNLAK